MNTFVAVLCGVAWIIGGLWLTCDLPPRIAEREGSAPWIVQEDTGDSGYARTQHGWEAWWEGDACHPDAFWGHDGSEFVWMRGMREPFVYAKNHNTPATRAADALRRCMATAPLAECELLMKLVETQRRKD